MDDLPAVGDELDLHTFRPGEVGSLVPEWIGACRAAGLLDVRLVHGKGTGQLAAGVRAMVERSALVREVRADATWGAIRLTLWDPATDEARVRAILEGCPRLGALLTAAESAGPPGAWIGAGAVRNRVWHRLHRRDGEPDDADVDVAWHGAGDAAADAAWDARLRATVDAPWEVTDQARYGAPSAEAGIARWPETATCVGARRRGGAVELYAAHGWGDVLGMVVFPTAGISEATWRARLAAKRWKQRFPWVRVERHAAEGR